MLVATNFIKLNENLPTDVLKHVDEIARNFNDLHSRKICWHQPAVMPASKKIRESKAIYISFYSEAKPHDLRLQMSLDWTLSKRLKEEQLKPSIDLMCLPGIRMIVSSFIL